MARIIVTVNGVPKAKILSLLFMLIFGKLRQNRLQKDNENRELQ